jgi:hypothetical protein
MTNERELLELAAKAAGIKQSISLMPTDGVSIITVDGRKWNAARDDGDSDRLGTAIQADVAWFIDCVAVDVNPVAGAVEYFKDHNGDKQKALRWARLRCAAAIGKEMA